jgi:iron complex transport system substrate-binding protein
MMNTYPKYISPALASLAGWLMLITAFWVTSGLGLAGAGEIQIRDRRTVVDQSGREIRIKKPYVRIISLYGAHTENLFALGLSQEIIGVSRNEVFPEAAKRKPVFSYREDPEKFLSVRPDLVLIRPMIERGYPKLIKRLKKSHITVVSLQPGNIDEMFRYWRVLGMLTGKTDQAETMIRLFKKKIVQIDELTREISSPKRIYFEAIHSKMKTFSPRAMPMFALKKAGGVNIATDAKSVRGSNIAAYGKERILSHAKEIDVFLAQKGVMNRVRIHTIKNEPGFHIIKAIQNNEIYLVDEMIVSRPTMRLLEGIVDIGARLYPDIFSTRAREELLNK